ncbi:TPA: hypothetical protein DDW35_05160 [Candidatus Sumerlaeota bacterium]|jgi:hypothetical protein|nr:hypothetical protein [Candidatus Sumerlaeota bacterium]
MNFEFSLRQLIVASLVILIVLACAAFPSLIPVSFFTAVYHSVVSELEVLHVIRTDALPMRVISQADTEQKEEQITKEYPRTRYEMYNPQDGLLTPPSEDAIQILDSIAAQYAERAGASLDSVGRCKQWLNARLNNQSLPETEESALQQSMQKTAPVIKKTLATLQTGAFSAEDLARTLPHSVADEGASPIAKMADLFALDALENKRQGKVTDAYFEIYNAAKALLPAPTAQLEDQRATLEGFDTIMHTWRTMVASDKQGERLETALTQMNDVGGELRQRLSQVRDPLSRDLMARIRQLPLEKKERDSVERTTPDYLFNFYSEKAHKYTTDPEKVAALDKKLEPLKEQVMRAMELRGKTAMAEPLALQEKATLAEMDMTRIGLAEEVKRLAYPEDTTTSPEKLTPRYLPYVPTDPFNNKGYSVRETNAVSTGTLQNYFSAYYSIGPDGKDQKGLLLYDPTNGATSVGDIYIP